MWKDNKIHDITEELSPNGVCYHINKTFGAINHEYTRAHFK